MCAYFGTEGRQAGNKNILDRRRHTRENPETGGDVYQATGGGALHQEPWNSHENSHLGAMIFADT